MTSTLTTIGDLYRSFNLAGRSAAIRTEIDDLSVALSSGRKTDLAKAVRGDFSPLAGIERVITTRSAFITAADETGDFLAAAQRSLELVSDLSDSVAPLLISAETLDAAAFESRVGSQAEDAFRATVSALNGEFAGRSLFAGVTTETTPLASADVILTALQTAVTGLTTAEDIANAVTTWFGPGGDFETVAYQGSTTPLASFRVSEDLDVDMTVTAADQTIRDVLAGFAIGALVRQGPLATETDERAQLAILGGEALLSSQVRLADLRADIGVSEQRIETAKTRNATEVSALEIAKNALISADPFDTAARLSEVQSQLEALYAITARNARLTLTEYLR